MALICWMARAFVGSLLVVVTALGAIEGYFVGTGSPLHEVSGYLTDLGYPPDHFAGEADWVLALIGALVGLFLGAIVLGPVAALLDMQRSMRRMAAAAERAGREGARMPANLPNAVEGSALGMNLRRDRADG